MIWIEKADEDGNKIMELENGQITTYYYEDEEDDGIIVDNHSNGVLTWNSIGVTHVNVQAKDFMVLITNGEMLTLSHGTGENDKNLEISIDSLITLIEEKGKTITELEKELEEIEDERESDSADDGTEA